MNNRLQMILMGLVGCVFSAAGMDVGGKIDPTTGLVLAPSSIVALGIEAQRAVGVPESLQTAIFVESIPADDEDSGSRVIKRTNSSDGNSELAYTTDVGHIFIKPVLLRQNFGVQRFTLFHEAVHKCCFDAVKVGHYPEKRAEIEQHADEGAAAACRCQDCLVAMASLKLPMGAEVDAILSQDAPAVLGVDGCSKKGYLTQLSLLARSIAQCNGVYCAEHSRMRGMMRTCIVDGAVRADLYREVQCLLRTVCRADLARFPRLLPVKEQLKNVLLWLAPQVLSLKGREELLRSVGYSL